MNELYHLFSNPDFKHITRILLSNPWRYKQYTYTRISGSVVIIEFSKSPGLTIWHQLSGSQQLSYRLTILIRNHKIPTIDSNLLAQLYLK